VAGADDVNGNCHADFYIGVPGADPGGRIDAGTAAVYSGDGGTLLREVDGDLGGDGLGRSVGSAHRPFGPLAAYLLGGMPFADRQGLSDAGSATVLGVENPCNCPHQGDVNPDGAVDVFDVIQEIAIAFSGGVDITDPACPASRGDVNNDGVADVFDVIQIIAVAFSGGAVTNPCGP
jgi:hypothetical protein